MNFFKNLFGKKDGDLPEPKLSDEHTIEEKFRYKVYPRIKNIDAQNYDIVYHLPLGGDLALTFVQDIDERITYVRKSEFEQLKHLIYEWRNNIAQVEFDLFTTETWNGIIFFNQPGDYSNEKIFDINFVNAACANLNTDKIIISISRRHRMQITNFYNDFIDGESFFWSHFSVWRNSSLTDEVITEYVLIAEREKGVCNIVNMGFRMNMYERDGKKLLSYAVFDDENDTKGDQINFQEIIERRKEKFADKSVLQI
ncbi:MAG: hypothetical protein REI64_12685 [Pedobacter sp.]|uniref:hypothetical protein n=1 Tax=Pedobacter sp. TaxID=1411316 RepID=UPI0028085395|nr:hypothetical protein [Pedobacter sp.]MDQ8005652.1 hypothetical protein [Pedobacter sp.]